MTDFPSHLISSHLLFSSLLPIFSWGRGDVCTQARERGGEGVVGGGLDSNIKVTGMLVVFLRGWNCRFWVSGRKANIFTYSAIALIKKYQSPLSGIGKWSPNGQIAYATPRLVSLVSWILILQQGSPSASQGTPHGVLAWLENNYQDAIQTPFQVLSLSASEDVLDITCSNYSKMGSKAVFKFSSLFDMSTTL